MQGREFFRVREQRAEPVQQIVHLVLQRGFREKADRLGFFEPFLQRRQPRFLCPVRESQPVAEAQRPAIAMRSSPSGSLNFSQRRRKVPGGGDRSRPARASVRIDSNATAVAGLVRTMLRVVAHREVRHSRKGKTIMNFAVSRILVPVDFSPHSAHALRYAAAFAGRLGALVEILHVVEEPVAAGAWSSDVPVPGLTELRDGLIAEAERQLDQCRPTIEDSHVRTLTTIRTGQPGQTIAAYAKTAGIDLIVMGTHGRGLSHLPMGSVTERVAQYAPCPVLTVRAREHEELERIFVADRAVLGSVLGHHGASRE